MPGFPGPFEDAHAQPLQVVDAHLAGTHSTVDLLLDPVYLMEYS
ncbi:hypothetical protein [Streptomyces mirabilis]|nr:hypothetical protein [Streptomyces mirabilis]MCX4427056.1 hypothetical protein [Streptomyces mirabilis]